MSSESTEPPRTPINLMIRFCLENKLVVAILLLFVVAMGIYVAPFDWQVGIHRDPVPVDAIPDIGENQQIVFTPWTGRSPQDVEDQITYPLTVSLLGVPGVKTIRSYSFFGFSSIYVVFNDDIDFYWSRTRVLEKLNSLPAGSLPTDVQPSLGPDATALGQIYWYTLEGHDENGNPTGGWDPHELRTIQDWYVRYFLQSAEGVSEVASVGGFVQEYQIDVNPDAMRAHRVRLDEIFMAVKMSNVDVGARTIEVNRVEYIIRGLGFIRSIEDIENTVIKNNDNVPIYVKNVAEVTLGPAGRRGALDKAGAEVVGGVVVVRYGENPLKVIQNVQKKIDAIAPGMDKKPIIDHTKVSPEEVRRFARTHGIGNFSGTTENKMAWLAWTATHKDEMPDWLTISQVKIVPFYDRTSLIYETLGTLNTALTEEILVTLIVVIVMVLHLRSSILISGLLPISVLICFIGMKTFGVDANIVALSGIAIAIGTMVDMGIVLCENILRHLNAATPGQNKLDVIYEASCEVGSAILTAVSTTVVSFLPVFTMTAAEGKLFKPLAYTKSFALIASVVVALTMIPPAAHILFAGKIRPGIWKKLLGTLLLAGGFAAGVAFNPWVGAGLGLLGLYDLIGDALPKRITRRMPLVASGLAVLMVAWFLTEHWLPLGPATGIVRNFTFVAILIGGTLLFFLMFMAVYEPILRWCLAHKVLFLSIPLLLILAGAYVWLGPVILFGSSPKFLHGYEGRAWEGDIEYASLFEKTKWTLARDWEGRGKEFMPPLDEGSFLYMPTTMPHASIGEALDVLSKIDKAIDAIPEVDSVVGKLGRVESPLDPAPVSMIETIINYRSEYATDLSGNRMRFKYDEERKQFVAKKGMTAARYLNPEWLIGIPNAHELLEEDSHGRPLRQWRPQIKNADDIWDEIVKAAEIEGTTSAPKLQPIAARIIMLQSGMRAPMGVKVYGPTLEAIDAVGLQIEKLLKEVPSVEASAVIADRVVGKPYLEIDINRDKIARYGMTVRHVQDVIEVAIGGRKITTTVEGRERFPVRVRYQRELRDEIESLDQILVTSNDGTQIPLTQVAEITFVRGPQVIKSENTFLVSYVLFDKKPGQAEVDVVEDCQKYLKDNLDPLLPDGVSYTFSGSYENQVRSEETLKLILPISLLVIFLILYFQFKSVPTTLLVFSGILVAWSGGFLMLWFYAQPWFLDFTVFGISMQDLFQVHSINLSVAVWVGFLALFGIASDDGVIMGTYLKQVFERERPNTISAIREATVKAGRRRIRPCLMTVATTILALIPVLTSTGRGAEIMVPMAIPSFGGMTVVLITVFVVPVLYCLIQEVRLWYDSKEKMRLASVGQNLGEEATSE